ncbi:hypothetical protein Ahy_A06g027638 [Arachis hypogaea]|uniref:Aminotransferase-like plant mobile domain-containing protein n=1 Tax=Arachis hypogaea TaxID=3818 RepID=A0A445CP88_ARAHY|nr:hypothetical protein Ahy_A06g027638 [Arachis hypogaea]
MTWPHAATGTTQGRGGAGVAESPCTTGGVLKLLACRGHVSPRMVRDYKAPEEHIINYLDHPIYPNRNLLVRKLDPSQSWNPRLGWVRSVRDEEPLDTEESIRRYVRSQISCLLGSTLFTDNHAERSTAWLEKTVVTFRHDIDYMQKFEWRPYQGMIIPGELHRHLDVCDIVAPLLSFECIEWHPADRVMRQFGFAQPPPRIPRDIPLEQHCMALRGVQLYD